MMLLTKVQIAMAIHAHRRTRGLLEGEYGSIHKGRSMDFDDLREYVLGDDIKDLDWKATARSPHPLVKRFVAVRKHTVLLVVGTGRGMAAQASPDDTKREVAILAAGVLGYLAVRHADLVGLVAGDSSGAEYLRPGGTTRHLEQLLRAADARMTLTSAPGDVTATLEYVVRSIRRRAILVLIDDAPSVDGDMARVLRRLAAQHEVLRIRVGDLEATAPAIAGRPAYDVESRSALATYLRRDSRLRAEVERAGADSRDEAQRALQRLGIASVEIAREADTVPTILRLLERHRRARV